MGSVLACARRCTDQASARDVAAETFTIVWRRWAEPEQPDPPQLYRTAALVRKNQERASRASSGSLTGWPLSRSR
jgi:ABC-type oligopeptide transport system substrate-binding subunit